MNKERIIKEVRRVESRGETIHGATPTTFMQLLPKYCKNDPTVTLPNRKQDYVKALWLKDSLT